MTRGLKFHFIFVLCAAVMIAAPSYAQKTVPTTKAPTPSTSTDLYKDLPEEYIAEATKYYESCSANMSTNLYRDCQCLALKFLDTRINMGPEVDKSAVAFAIRYECVDATNAAGYTYDKCERSAPFAPKNIPLKEYCTCYASTYAKLFESTRAAPSSKAFFALQSQAHAICSDEALALKVYPESAGMIRQRQSTQNR